MVAREELSRQLEVLAGPVLSEAGIELVDLSLRPEGAGWTVFIRADKASGGITIDECSQLNRRLRALLEENKILGDDFSLEVSSPGLDWPLQTKRDFLRVPGRELRVFLSEPVADRIEIEGRLIQVNDLSVVLEPLPGQLKKGAASGPVEVPFEKINKAVQII